MAYFDATELMDDHEIEFVIEVDCLVPLKGEALPTLTLRLNDVIRKKHKEAEKKHLGKIIMSATRRSQKVSQRIETDRTAFCLEMADLCVKESTGLIAPTHTIAAFKQILLRYPPFEEWFANQVTEVFTTDAKFKKDDDEESEKN